MEDILLQEWVVDLGNQSIDTVERFFLISLEQGLHTNLNIDSLDRTDVFLGTVTIVLLLFPTK